MHIPLLRWAVLTAVVFVYLWTGIPVTRTDLEPARFSKKDRMDLAMAQEVEMTRDPAIGLVPRERMLAAYQYAERLRQEPSARAAIANVNWTERGPTNVGGRTRALLVDPNDPTGHTVWAGGVAGGLWKTTDITAATPVWQPIDDFFDNLAITCLAYDPADPDVRYFGTGEGYFNSDAVRGLGIWKSTDAGNTWNPLLNTQNATFRYCFRIVIPDSGEILVATRSGLQRSTNGGATWTKVLGGAGVSNTIYDLEMAANGHLFATPSGSVRRSTDGGATWSGALTLPVSADRIEVACAPSDSNYLYALVELGNGVEGVLWSTNGGTTWISRNEPNDADPGINANDFSRSQAWYDLCIAVDPNNRDVLWVGGIDLFKSTNNGNSWNQVSHWYGGFGFQEVHADQHLIHFEPGSSSVVYFTNDGGVYRSSNGTVAVPTLDRKEFGYQTTQFYACDLHPDAGSDHFLAGAQDNGTQRFSVGGINNTVEVTGGDGAFCHIDQDEPQYQFNSYVYNNYFRSSNGGNSFISLSFSNNGRFINPTDYDDDANLLYAAENSGDYLRWDNPQTGNSRTVVAAGFSGMVSAVTCDPNVRHRVYFGTGGGDVYKVDSAHSGTPVVTHINNGASMPGGYISCIAVETGDTDHLLVTYSSYGVNSVWETGDGGANWSSVEGNLPDMPVRWALFNPHTSREALLATELGVWSTDLLDGGNTVWGPSNNGLANVRTDMLKVRSSDNLLIAATHGRGLFSSDIFMQVNAGFDADRRIVYLNKPVQFTDKSAQANSWEWDFGDGNTSTAQNPAHSYTSPGLYSVTLSVNGGVDADTQLSYIQVLPDRGNTYPAAFGGDFESNLLDFGALTLAGTGFELGSSAVTGKQGTFSGNNAWVTGLSGNYVDNSETHLYTPNFDLSLFGAYTFRFRSRFKTETGYDGFRVEYSLDRGDTWTRLGGAQAFWYNFANTGGGTPFPTNEPYFNGNRSNAFNEYYYDVSSLSGNANLAFRFVFISDPFVTDPGVAIDEVELENYVLAAPQVQLAGKWEGKAAILSWQIERENEVASMELWRSGDGLTFSRLAVLGRENGMLPREFVDGEANVRNYYRLRLTDASGGETLSNVVALANEEVQEVFLMYPNPAHSEVWLELAHPGRLRLLDATGSLVREEALSEGRQRWSLEGLSSGIYLVVSEAENGRISTQKLWVK